MEGPQGVHLKNRKKPGVVGGWRETILELFTSFNLWVRMGFPLEIKYRTRKSALNPGNVGSFCKERLERARTEAGMGVTSVGQGLKTKVAVLGRRE